MPLKRIYRRRTEEERKRDAKVIEAAYKDFPPKYPVKKPPPGLPAAICAARKAQDLSWYALAQKAGIPNQGTIRDIEQGKDVKLSSIQAVAKALGMELELVPSV